MSNDLIEVLKRSRAALNKQNRAMLEGLRSHKATLEDIQKVKQEQEVQIKRLDQLIERYERQTGGHRSD